MRFDLTKAKDWADFVLKVLSCAGILAGGWWAYHQWDVTESTASNLQLDLTTEAIRYSETESLLVIHAKPKNIGKILISPGKDGLVVTVKAVPNGLGLGPVDLSKLPELYRADVIKAYAKDGYELEPGAQYDELLPAVVKRGGTYAIRAEFDLGDNTEVDTSEIVRVD